MMTPALFGENLLDDFFGFPFRRNFVSPFFAESDKLTGNLMQTDVKEQSLYDTGVEPKSAQSTVTLMTCTPAGSQYRFLVHGVLAE